MLRVSVQWREASEQKPNTCGFNGVPGIHGRNSASHRTPLLLEFYIYIYIYSGDGAVNSSICTPYAAFTVKHVKKDRRPYTYSNYLFIFGRVRFGLSHGNRYFRSPFRDLLFQYRGIDFTCS